MAADPVPDPLPEIRRLLSADGGIPGLPQFWRDACAELAAKLPVEQQRRYLSEHLQPLDAYFRPAAESPGPLRNACEWLSSPTGLSCIYERFCSTSDAERRLFFLYESLDALRYYPLAGVLSVCHIVVPTRPWEDVKDPEFVIALTILGSSLYLCERVRESTALLETYLGLEPGDYKDRDQLRERLEGQEIKEKLPNLNDRGTYLATLAAALHMTTGRGPHQAATLLEAYLRLEQSDYEPRDKLRAKLEGPEIEEKLPDLNNRGNCLRTLAAALYMTTGRGPSEAAALLEAYLRLEPGDYEDSAKLRHKLEGPEIEEKLPDLNNRGVCLQTLAAALHQTTGRGPGEAVTLLEAYLVLEPGDYQYLDQLREQLKGHEIKEKLPSSNTRGNCLQTLAAALHMTTDRGPGHAAALLEAYLGLEPGDYQYLDQLREKLNDHEIKEKLSSPNTHGISLATLAAALHMTTDRGPGHATKLLETYLGLEPGDYQDRDQLRVKLEGHEIKEKLSNPDNRSIYLRTLADSLRLTADRGPGKAATLLVAYVRPSLSQIADSSDLQGVAPSNRLELVAAYCDCINGTDPQVLEIGRAVVEYIQSIRDRELPTYQHRADFLENAGKLWPALHRLARERIDHERKQRNTDSAEALELELALWAEQFQNRLLVERLFDDSLLASGREPGSDGASLLVDWKPWRPISEAGGPDEAGGRSPGGNEEQSDHDRLCYGTVATERRAGGQRRRMAGHALSREELLPAGVRLDDLVPRGALYIRALFEDTSTDSGLRWWAWRHDEDGCLTPVQHGRSGSGALGQLAQAVEDFARAEEDFADLKMQSGAYCDAFDALVAAMNQSMDLSSLECRGQDLVFHVEGPLLSLPLAWLNSQNGPLWEVAGSTSSVVSLTLRQAAAKLPWQANRRTLNAHWQDVNCHEKATDLLDYMRETRQIQAEALKKWELWSLGAPDELPRATVEHLIAALAGKTFDVVLVNAHGDRHDGVLLANNVLWRGDGANFQGTDLLVLACCSVGDLRQRTATDVEGFYATLAAHRCRTVVAPRWPINAITTKLFTEKLLSKYANKRQAAGDGGLPDFAKARCLAEARRELLLNSEVSRAKRRIQAITLSAFELYGVA